MENHVECFCQSDENHREIGCFFKYVIFLLKQFVSSSELLQMDPQDGGEILKTDIWIQIVTQYDGYFTGEITINMPNVYEYLITIKSKMNFLSTDCETDSACVDGCMLKSLQMSTENQLKILAK